MAKKWTQDVFHLHGNDSGVAFAESDHFDIPVGSVLRRTIVSVSALQFLLFDSGSFPKPFSPVCWYVGDGNSDVEPQPDEFTSADNLSGFHVLAAGQFAVQYAFTTVTNTADGTATQPAALTDQDIHMTYRSSTAMYAWGQDRADSNAQRRFFDGHPRINASIVQFFLPSVGYNDVNPTVHINVHQLWDV